MYCIRIACPEVLMSSADRYSRYYSLITGQGAGVIYSSRTSSDCAALIPHSGLPRTEAFLIDLHGSTTRSCGRVFLDRQAQILHDQTPKEEVLITFHICSACSPFRALP
jgi:hypothetical protein